jgi:hypothetical protein
VAEIADVSRGCLPTSMNTNNKSGFENKGIQEIHKMAADNSIWGHISASHIQHARTDAML